MITRRTFGTALAAGAVRPGKPPNIVFVCSDQHDGRAMGAMGHPLVKTPHMDRLAAMGTLFRNTYCASPVCCPSRASLMTGMFPSDVGSYCNSTAFDGKFPTWGNRLRDAGYTCWATGKLDLAPGRDLGFAEVETEHGNFQEPDITSLFRRPSCYRVGESKSIEGGVRKKPHPDEARVRTAVSFLAEEARRETRPWVMYLGMEQPKAWGSGGLRQYLDLYPPEKVPLPNIPPGHLEEMHPVFHVLRNYQLLGVPIPEARVRRARAAYYARVTEVDACLGAVLDRLEKNGQLEQTVIVYTSDHGEMLGEHGLWMKNSLLEASARVPLVMAGPGIPRGKVVETAVSQVDLVATLLELGGAPRPRELRGHSLLANHPGYAVSECHSHGNPTGSFMIRKGDWKYIYFSWYEPLLFNLREDPDELVNRAKDAKTEGIRRELDGILRSLVDPDAVTLRAFAEQDRRLEAMVRAHDAAGFRKLLAGRLGKGQAEVLTRKYYPAP